MNTLHNPRCALIAIACVTTSQVLAATREVNERRPADASGTVDISNVAGSVTVSGWDRNEVQVTGTLGDKVERLEFSGSGEHTTVRVILPRRSGWGGDSEAHLAIRVPQKSELQVSVVSADLRTAGVSGLQELQSVSGNISGEVQGDLEVESVSGDVTLTARQARRAQIETVSGDLGLTGASGEIEISTVSGDATLRLGSIASLELESVSGNVELSGSLAERGRIQAESVSGDVKLQFAGAPAAEFEIETFSGEIRNCFGPKPVAEDVGPGTSLEFRHGAGGGRVSIETRSGDVSICDR